MKTKEPSPPRPKRADRRIAAHPRPDAGDPPPERGRKVDRAQRQGGGLFAACAFGHDRRAVQMKLGFMSLPHSLPNTAARPKNDGTPV